MPNINLLFSFLLQLIKKLLLKLKNKDMDLKDYSVEKECPHEQLFVTLGLEILNPEPIKLSI